MIIAPAVLKNGNIYTGGVCHHDVMSAHKSISDGNKGFITDTGVFVTRTEAAKIAYACKQTADNTGILFSYDIQFTPQPPEVIKSKPDKKEIVVKKVKPVKSVFKGIDDEQFFS